MCSYDPIVIVLGPDGGGLAQPFEGVGTLEESWVLAVEFAERVAGEVSQGLVRVQENCRGTRAR